MELVRDVLDNRLVDRRKRPMGRVDGVILAARDGAAPRVIAIESGLTTLLRRIHPGLARLAAAVAHRLGLSTRPIRIPVAHVVAIAIDIELDVRAEETGAYRVERWLRDHVVRRIPGSGG
jgi:hypothetical protein